MTNDPNTLDTQLLAAEVARLVLQGMRDNAVSPPEYFNTHQAAQYLGVTPRCLEEWRRKGTGPQPTRCGRLVRYSIKSLRQFMEGTGA
ncbi:MAG: helix-turn-helix domain-containing protein [bacterium]